MNKNKFNNKVQLLRYKVLKEVASFAWKDTLLENISEIPKIIAPGKIPTMRCCVYKERAILAERVRFAVGGNRFNKKVIQVIDIACDECPSAGYEVSSACRGCLAHHCEDVCKRGAIIFDHNHVAHIDKSKCVECGACAKVCPYTAIINHKRPCQVACKVKAISINESKVAVIDHSKCISCGACVYQCPFGAISDKSFILSMIDIIKKSENNTNYKVYAIVAPSISSQFTYAKLGQVITGLKEMGFYNVLEVALGADMVAYSESQELAEKGFLTSSCCPAFVDFIEKHFPHLKHLISHNLSPMGTLAKYIKSNDPTCKVVFIGPCTAKKMEFQKDTVKDYVDCVITFEELQAVIDSLDIDICTLEESTLDNASYYGRIFARTGGLSEAVSKAIEEQNIDFEVKPIVCDGIEQCKMALLRKGKNALDANFIEGMACINGCISGAGCLSHGEKGKKEVDKHSKEAMGKSIGDAISSLK